MSHVEEEFPRYSNNLEEKSDGNKTDMSLIAKLYSVKNLESLYGRTHNFSRVLPVTSKSTSVYSEETV